MVAKYTTSAGGVVVNSQGDIAVVKQSGNVWSLPKGHIESDENPLEAAKREIFEETGLTRFTLVKELGRYKRFRIGEYGGEDQSEIKTIRMYLFTTDLEDFSPHDASIIEAYWLSKKETLKRLSHRKDREFFRSILGEF